MPNRILKESICTSKTIDELSQLEENAFYRLIVNCDDYGRMDGRTSVLRSKLFPLKDIRNEQMAGIMNRFAAVGLVSLYEVDGDPFVQLVKWDKHQTVRAKKSKYPPPPAFIGNHLQADASRHMQDESKCYRNPIQSESNPNPESESNTTGSGLLTDAEQDALGQSYRDGMAAIEDAAKSIGMPPWSQSDITTAEALMVEYTAEWVVTAIKRAADGPERTWRYIKGTLRNWRTKGGIDNGPAANKGQPQGLRGNDPSESPGGVPGGLTAVERY